MKTNCKIIFLLFALFYLGACSDSEKNNLPPCLLTVDITVIDVDSNTKKMVPVATGGIAPYYYEWDVSYGGQDTVTVTRNQTGLYGPGQHVVKAKDENFCEAYDTVTITFPPGDPISLTVNSVKVTYFSPLNNGNLWDADSSNADLRLSINTGSNYSRDELYTSQIFADQTATPVTFSDDFPYQLAKLDTYYTVSLWDDDTPLDPQSMQGVAFHPDNYTTYPDSIMVQSGNPTAFPRFTLYVTWNY